MTDEDPRLTKLSDICLELPEAIRTDSGRHSGFSVRKKTFAWFLDDHHGDGIVSVCCKMGLGENEEIVQADPERFYLPAYVGHRGWVALRLDLGEIDWEEVAGLVVGSYTLVAPKKLVKKIG
ncbi:MAG TPA: MmcQ/YjbR family DNA-binding protein [Thermoanaerobaculia bacterium]|nr:MmcQ/YjbR family DNA-binding protein [Thermoanaerobaculia bacterium]